MADDWTAVQDNRSDAELTAAYRDGEQSAAAELYRRYYLKLLHGVATKLPSFEIAEDCVSEAFLNVLEIIRRGSGPTSNVYGYLRSAVAREAARYYRDRALGPGLDEVLEDGGDQPTIDDDVSHIEESLLTPALRELPQKWRDLVSLRYIEMLKPAQIAKLLDTDAPALHKMLYRAKKGLRDEYLKQIALSRSSLSCREYASGLTDLAIAGSKSEPSGSFEGHLLLCSECQATLAELKYQFHRASPEALALGILVGGLVAGSTLALGGVGTKASAVAESSGAKTAATVGETATRSVTTLKTLASTGKVASVGGVFQTLGTAGTFTIGALLVASLAGAALVYASSASQSHRADSQPSAVEHAQNVGGNLKKTVRTNDGDCELSISIQSGILVVDAAVHAGQCWFSYNRVGDVPREEALVSTGWMVVTRVSGDYQFKLRSETDTKKVTITL